MNCICHISVHVLTGNGARLSSRTARRHLSDWVDQNGYNSGYERSAGEGWREDCALGHEGLQRLAAHWHSGQAEAV